MKIQICGGREMNLEIVEIDGRAYVPADQFGRPQAVFLCCSYDGEQVATGPDGRLFVPLDWARQEYPEHQQTEKK